MWINNLLINQVRNHNRSRLNFCKGLNILYGQNGAGKTTVLESIAVCGFSKSFLSVPDNSLVQIGNDFLHVKAEAFTDLDIPYKVRVRYFPGRRKEISSNAGDNLSPKDIIGEIPLTVLSPDFRNITSGSPADRRQFIDRVLSQASKLYIDDIFNLKKCLKQRNNLLSNAKKDRFFDYSVIEPWTELLIETGAKIILRRKKFIDEFRPYFREVYSKVSSGREKVNIEYLPDNIPKGLPDSSYKYDDIISIYKKLADDLQKDERNRGTSLFGPQKDEVAIRINSGIAREIASQGQHKTLLISIKFAEFNFLKNIRQETPVILLDDIFSELDEERSKTALDMVMDANAQTFVTITNPGVIRSFLPPSENCMYFRVEEGDVIPVEEVN